MATPFVSVTSLIRPGHLVNKAALFWPELKSSQSLSYLKNPFKLNTATPLIQAEFLGPLVTGLTGFYCRMIFKYKYQELRVVLRIYQNLSTLFDFEFNPHFLIIFSTYPRR